MDKPSTFLNGQTTTTNMVDRELDAQANPVGSSRCSAIANRTTDPASIENLLQVTHVAPTFVFLDRVLGIYGPQAL
jgi:hypothetical protein